MAVADIHIFADEGLAAHLEAFIADQVRLVKSVSFDQLEDLKGLILNAARQGLRVEELTAQIEQRFGVSRKRAELIATDQVGKLNGEITRLRQQNLGVRRYVWSTSNDERVRRDHRALDRTVQSWSEAPVVNRKTGKRAHPGGDFRCRCQALPVVDDVLVDAGVMSEEEAAENLAVLTKPPPKRQA